MSESGSGPNPGGRGGGGGDEEKEPDKKLPAPGTVTPMKRSDSKEQSKAAAWSSAGGGSGAAAAAARRSSRSADELDRKISSKLASAANNGNGVEKQPSTQTLQSVGGTVYEFPTTPETRKPAAQAALPVPGTVTPVPSSAPRGKGEGNGYGSHGRSPVPGTVTPVSALDDRIRSKASMRSSVGAVAVSNGDKSPQVSDMIRRIEAKSVVGGGGGGGGANGGGRGNNNPPTTPVTPVSDVDRRIQEKVRASMTKVTPRTPSSRTSSGAADGAPATTPTLSSAPAPPPLTGLKMGNEDGAFIAGNPSDEVSPNVIPAENLSATAAPVIRGAPSDEEPPAVVPGAVAASGRGGVKSPEMSPLTASVRKEPGAFFVPGGGGGCQQDASETKSGGGGAISAAKARAGDNAGAAAAPGAVSVGAASSSLRNGKGDLKASKEAAAAPRTGARTSHEDRWRSKVDNANANAAASTVVVGAAAMSGQPGMKSSEAVSVVSPGAVVEVRGAEGQGSVLAGKSTDRSPMRRGGPTAAEDRWRNKVDAAAGGRPPSTGQRPGGAGAPGRRSSEEAERLMRENSDEAGIGIVDAGTHLMFPVLADGNKESGVVADEDKVKAANDPNADSKILAEIGDDVEEGYPQGSRRRIQAEIGEEMASVGRDGADPRGAAFPAAAAAGGGDAGGDPEFFMDEGRISVPTEVGGEAYVAQLAPEEERDHAVAAMEVTVVDEKMEEEVAKGRRFTGRDKAVLGAVGLAVVGLGVGLGVGLSKDGGPQPPTTAAETCEYKSPWILEGQNVNRSGMFSDHIINGTLSQLYTAFGSDMTISNDGNRMAVVDRYGDNIAVYERSEESSGWVQLGSSILSGEGGLIFESYGDDGGENDEAIAAAVISGDGRRVAVTSPFHSSANVTRSGRVRVYALSNNGNGMDWTQVGNDILGEYDYAYLGRALTLDLSEDGSTLAVGDFRRNSRTGCVSIYTLNSTYFWTLLGGEFCGAFEWDRMGGSVSLSSNGRTVAVGVQGDNLDAGRADIYQFSDDDQQWAQVGGSILPDPGHCRFGWPVSLSADGTRVAVSGSSYLGNVSDCVYDAVAFEAPDSGDVRVWELQDGNWTQISPAFVGTNDRDGFGWSVSLSGDGSTVAMGASNSDLGGPNQGYARAYRLECGEWTQVGADINGTEANDWTGHAVSLSYNGEGFAVSSPNDYGIPKQKSGVVSVYGGHNFQPVCPEYTSPWVQVGQVVNRSETEVFADHSIDGTLSQLYTAFGSDVTISNDGDRMAVVDRYGDNATVYVQSEGGLGWIQLGPSILSQERDLFFDAYEEGGEYYEALAAAVISGDGRRVAVTSPFHSSVEFTRSGRVRVYEFIDDGGRGSWTQVGSDILGEYDLAYLGRQLTVDLSDDGSTLAIGDYRRNNQTGCVSIYTLSDNIWTLLGEDICGEYEYDRMGGSVSLSSDGRTVAVGVQGDYLDAGRAAVFQYSSNDQQWAQVGSSIFSDPGHCRFGWPVSLSANGTRIAVSGSGYLGNISDCYNDDRAFVATDPASSTDPGSVGVWELQDGNWAQIGQKLLGTNDTDRLGWSVSLSGDGSTIAMGASNSDRGNVNQGYARAYRYNECGRWTQVGRDIEGAEADDWTGHALSLSYNGERFAVSSPNDFGLPDPKQKSGIVAVFGNEF